MGSFQQWLERANARYGAVGAIVTTALCLAVLIYALVTILGDFW
jgi:hypothetical protein